MHNMSQGKLVLQRGDFPGDTAPVAPTHERTWHEEDENAGLSFAACGREEQSENPAVFIAIDQSIPPNHWYAMANAANAAATDLSTSEVATQGKVSHLAFIKMLLCILAVIAFLAYCSWGHLLHR